jgi:hypothetical protein
VSRLDPFIFLKDMKIKFAFLVAMVAHSAISADIDWQLIPNAASGTQVWVESSRAKFDGNTVTVSFKSEKPDGGAVGLVSVNCSNFTIHFLGGEIHDKNGKVHSKKSQDEKVTPAPTGTTEGALHRFVCDLRPAWRKLLQ